MFHPLIFDNIKVVLEGAVYDRDFDGTILITGRTDSMDLATYHRLYQIDFRLAGEKRDEEEVYAQMQLCTSLPDIAGELLEKPLTDPIGCTICIHFFLTVAEVEQETEAIARLLNEIWGNRPYITQTIKARLKEYQHKWPPERFENQITLDFHRKIDEGNIEDLRGLVEHTIASLEQLQQRENRR
ncbi:hypothetical protein KDJ56_18405 [Brevibacillus composti]|uniref:Uncharacterized protein n=1 Tax=Brevibacillus composti TaxID=2796470 RepID=A0A7T5EJL9_9BACL|nr:hypothetical protein [Brevibacillus composti]QQE73824.1 hypothetical protein JD108_18465 [Brevibacillus composti]QUO40909.1 hypothetical protein KDJ56_18405 [Brevibacillus composti]